jgi:hypothetical protein
MVAQDSGLSHTVSHTLLRRLGRRIERGIVGDAMTLAALVLERVIARKRRA